MSGNEEFFKSVSGGTVANMIFAMGFLVYRLCSTKCKHSKCKSHTKCFECSSQEDSYIIKDDDDEDEHKIRDEFNQNLSKLLGKLETRLSEKREKVIRTNTLRGSSSGFDEMAKESGIEKQV